MGLVLCLAGAGVPAVGYGAQARSGELELAERLIDGGDPEQAMEVLNRMLKKSPSAEGYLLRSTAFFVLGDRKKGEKDLDRALKTDPALRQGWLNRAALDLSEARYDDALAALSRARELDPGAADNDLNIGAVLLLKGDVAGAETSFGRYLEDNARSAEAHYLVASNYAGANDAGRTVRHLRDAVALDERVRARARTDPSFNALAGDASFQQLLNTDAYRPPAGTRTAAAEYEALYRGGNGRLMPAVVDVLQASGIAFDPRVDVTPEWAVIWADMRIKVSSTAEGKGRIELSAPAARFDSGAWARRTEEFFRRVRIQLVSRTRK